MVPKIRNATQNGHLLPLNEAIGISQGCVSSQAATAAGRWQLPPSKPPAYVAPHAEHAVFRLQAPGRPPTTEPDFAVNYVSPVPYLVQRTPPRRPARPTKRCAPKSRAQSRRLGGAAWLEAAYRSGAKPCASRWWCVTSWTTPEGRATQAWRTNKIFPHPCRTVGSASIRISPRPIASEMHSTRLSEQRKR